MTRIEPVFIERMIETTKADLIAEQKIQQGPQDPAIEAIAPEINYDDFAKLDFRIAKIVAAKRVEKSDRCLQLTLDIGGETRNVFAGLANAYKPEDLEGKLTVMVANLAPRKMRFGISEGMVLAAGSGETETICPASGFGRQTGHASQLIAPGLFAVVFSLWCLRSPHPRRRLIPRGIYQLNQDRVFQVRVLNRETGKKSSIGSGFIVGDGRQLATNYHVISQVVLEPELFYISYISNDGSEGELSLQAWMSRTTWPCWAPNSAWRRHRDEPSATARRTDFRHGQSARSRPQHCGGHQRRHPQSNRRQPHPVFRQPQSGHERRPDLQ